MKTYEIEFLKIVKLNACTEEEFSKAKLYFETASISEKGNFLNSIFIIVEKTLKEMYSKGNIDFRCARNCYQKFGLTDAEFYSYFNLYIEKFAPKTMLNMYNELKKIEKNRMIENIFYMAKDLEWNNLGKIANFYNITIILVKEYIVYYAYQVLKFDKKKFAKFKKLYKAFKAFVKLKNCNLDSALEYFNTYANEEEKKLFNDTLSSLIFNIKNLLCDKNSVSNYLNNIGLSEYELVSLIVEFYAYDKDLVFSVSKLFKNYYEFANSVNWNTELVTEEAKKNNMKYQQYVYLAKLYAKNVLNILNIEEKIYCAKNSNVGEPKFVSILNQILMETDEEIIYNLFDKNKLCKDHIFRFIYSKARGFSKDEQEKYEQDLMKKYKLYLQTKKEKNAKFKKITEEDIITFLNSSLNVKDFCKANNFSINGFNDLLSKLNDKTLILKVQEKIKRQQMEANLDLINEKQNRILNYQNSVRLLISYIEHGITINGIAKDFDLLDFFVLFKDINPNKLTYPFLSIADKQVIVTFFNPLYKAYYFNRNTIINSYYEMNYLLDDNGKPIYNSGRIITKDELIFIIDFMSDNGVPMNEAVFNVALKRYLNNTLDIYKTSIPTLK